MPPQRLLLLSAAPRSPSVFSITQAPWMRTSDSAIRSCQAAWFRSMRPAEADYGSPCLRSLPPWPIRTASRAFTLTRLLATWRGDGYEGKEDGELVHT